MCLTTKCKPFFHFRLCGTWQTLFGFINIRSELQSFWVISSLFSNGTPCSITDANQAILDQMLWDDWCQASLITPKEFHYCYVLNLNDAAFNNNISKLKFTFCFEMRSIMFSILSRSNSCMCSLAHSPHGMGIKRG